jgi:polyisoprenoid-binding protein YceI
MGCRLHDFCARKIPSPYKNNLKIPLRKTLAKMKSLFIILVFAFSLSLSAQPFIFDSELSKVTFAIKNFGATVRGEFHQLNGEFYLDEENISKNHFDASVDAASIDTGIGLRDKHLKRGAYFDAERFPKMRITSNRIVKEANGMWRSYAQVTLKGITKEAVIDFKIETNGQSRIFTAAMMLNRLDFNVGESSFSLSDSVMVQIRVVGNSK